MAGLTLEQFEAQVVAACAASPIVTGVSPVAASVATICLRAHFTDGSFADAFYNEDTGKTALAFIQEGRRIFGADNTGGWHWHPFEAPDSHISSDTAVAFDEFLRRVEAHVGSRK